MKRWVYVIIPLGLLVVLIVWRLNQKRGEVVQQAEQREARTKAPRPVSIAPVQVRDVVQTFSAVGTVEAPLNVKIAPKVTGRLDFLQVREGDRVTTGQLLARIDPSEVEAEVNRQQAVVAEAQFRLAQAQINRDPALVAVQTEIRQQQAALTGAQAEYKQARASDRAQRAGAVANVEDVGGRIRSAQAGVSSAEADYNQSRENYAEQLAAAVAAVTDAQGRIKSAGAAIESAEADYNQTRQNYAAQLAAAQATVTDAQGRISSADAAMASAQAEIRAAQANLDNARGRYNRIYSLYKQGFIAAQEVDDARAVVKVEQGDVDVAKEKLEGAKAQRQSAVAQRQSAERQAEIVATKGKADIESARTKVVQAQAGRESAVAQREAAEKQAEIARTKGKADIEVARSKVLQARAARDSAIAQRQAAQQQVTLVGNKSDVDIEVARTKIAQSAAALRAAQSNMALKSSSVQNISALRSVVAAAEANLRSAEARRTDTFLRSPIDGVVTERTLDPGAVAGPSQPILTVQSVRQLWFTAPVPEEVSRKTYVGQSADVVFDALPNRKFISKVARINPAADPASRQFTLRLTLDNPDNSIKPGMFGRVTMVTERVRNAVVVPREAVQQDESGGAATVVVVNANSETEKRTVTLGASDPKGYAILAGVQPGEKVVVLTATPLREGQSVRTGDRPGGAQGGARAGGSPGSGGNAAGSGAGGGRPGGGH